VARGMVRESIPASSRIRSALSFRTFLPLAFCLLPFAFCLLPFAFLISSAAEPLERTRRVLLPREEFLRLGEAHPEGVIVSGADLRRLESRIAAARAVAPAEEGQVPLALASASYDAQVLPGTLRGRGLLELVTDRQGWQSLRLPAAAELLGARLVRGDAAVVREPGALLVHAFGPGPHTLELDFDVPLQARGEASFAYLQLAGPGELHLAVPESLAPAVGGATLVPLQPVAEDGLLAYLLPVSGTSVALEMGPRAVLAAEALLEVTGRHLFHVEPLAVRGVHELDVQIWSAPLRRLEVVLPEGSYLAGMDGAELRGYEVRDGRVHVALSRPTRRTKLQVQTLWPAEPPYRLRLAAPAVAGARWDSGFAELLPHERLDVSVEPAGSARQVPLAASEKGAAPVRQRFFLPGADAALVVHAGPAGRRVRADLDATYHLGAAAARLAGQLALQVQGPPLRSVTLEIDARDRILELSLDGDASVAWEVRPGADEQRQSLHVTFPPHGGSLLRFAAERLLDRSALDGGVLPLTLHVPRLTGGAARTRVVLGSEPDLHLSLRERPGFFVQELGELREPVAYVRGFQSFFAAEAFRGQAAYALLAAPDAGALGVELSPRQPRLEAETTTFAHFTEAALRIHAEVRFVIREAATDVVQIALPPGTGSRIRIEAEGLQERALSSTPEQDLWTLRLREKVSGELAVQVSFDRPLAPERRQTLRVPEVGAAGVARDEGTVLLEAADNLALRVLHIEGRELLLEDVPAAAFYTPSDRLLAAYHTLARPYGLEAEILRYEPLPVLGAIATEGLLRTVVLADGRRWTEATYALNNSAAQFLPVALPEGARLWSALIDEQPVKPFRSRGRVMLSLRPGTQSVRVVYEERAASLGALGRSTLVPPDIGLPMLRLRWQLHPPAGYDALLRGFGREAGFEHIEPRLPRVLESAAGAAAILLMPVWLMVTLDSGHAPMDMATQREMSAFGYAGDMPSPAAAAPGAPPSELARMRSEAGERDSKEETAKPKKAAPSTGLPADPEPRVPDAGAVPDGLGVLPLELSLEAETPHLQIAALTGDGSLELYLARSTLLSRARAALILAVAATSVLLGAVRGRVGLSGHLAALLVLALLPALAGPWAAGPANAATDGVLIGLGVSVLLALVRRLGRRGALAAAAGALALVLAAPAWAGAPQAFDAGEEPATIYVPYHVQSGRIVEDERAFLTREQFRRFFEMGQPPAVEMPEPPIAWSVRSLELQGTLEEGSAALRMRLGIDLLGEDWAEVPVPISGTIEGVRLDGKPVALLTRSGPAVLVRGRGAHELELDLRVPDEDPGPGTLLRLRLPHAAAGRLHLLVPAGLEASVSPDRGVHLRRDTAGTWLDAAVAAPEALVRVRPAPVTAAAGVQVENWLELQPAPGRFELRGRLRLTAAEPLPSELVLDAPPQLVLQSLQGAGLRSWRLDAGRLVLGLEPERRSLDLQLQADLGAGPEVRLVAFAPPGTSRLQGAVLVRRGSAQVLQLGEATGLRRVEPAEAHTAWARLPEAARWSAADLQRVQWAFLPEEPRFSLSLRAVDGQPSVSCRPSLLLRVDETGAELLLSAEYEVRDWPVYELPVTLPAGWSLQGARSEPAGLWRLVEQDGKARLRVEMPQGLLGTGRVVSHWSWRRPAAHEAFVLPIPEPDFGAATLRPGELGLSAPDSLALNLQPGPRSRLSPAGPEAMLLRLPDWPLTQAFHFRDAIDATLRPQPQTARITATVVQHLLAGESRLQGQALLLYEIGEPGVDVLRFQAPASVARTLEVEGARLRNVERSVAGGAVLVTVELHGAARGAYPLEVRWALPIELGKEMPVPRLVPRDATPAGDYVLVETDPVVLVTAQPPGDAEAVTDLEQVPTLPGSLRPEQVRWIYRYRSAQGTLGLKVERPKTEDVLQAIVDISELVSVVDGQGHVRTRARFELQNRTEQFLDVLLPPGTELYSAAVAGAPVKPARSPSGAEGGIRVPLPRQSAADLSFAAELWYVSRVPLHPLRGNFELEAPRVTNIPVKKALWTLWMPAELGLSFAGSFEKATEGELTTEKVLEVIDLQNRLVGALSSSAGRKRDKIVQNLAELEQRYGALEHTAQEQLQGRYRTSEDDALLQRNRRNLDQLRQGRASFDENLRRIRQAPDLPEQQMQAQVQAYQNVMPPQAEMQQAVTANWALTSKGMSQLAQSEAIQRQGQRSASALPGGADLGRLGLEPIAHAPAAAGEVAGLYDGLDVPESSRLLRKAPPPPPPPPRATATPPPAPRSQAAGPKKPRPSAPASQDSMRQHEAPRMRAAPGTSAPEMESSDDLDEAFAPVIEELGDDRTEWMIDGVYVGSQPGEPESAASPNYYDFGSIDEIAVVTGEQQTGGVGVEVREGMNVVGGMFDNRLSGRRGDVPVPPVEVQASVRREGYLSLSLDFPTEGQSHHFKKLEGEGTIQVHYTSGRIWSRMVALSALAAGIAGLWLLARTARALRGAMAAAGALLRRRAGSVFLASLGIFGLLGIPLFLLVALVSGALFAARIFQAAPSRRQNDRASDNMSN
jgi:hypothetical protein